MRLTLVWKPEAFGTPNDSNKFKSLQKGSYAAGIAKDE